MLTKNWDIRYKEGFEGLNEADKWYKSHFDINSADHLFGAQRNLSFRDQAGNVDPFPSKVEKDWGTSPSALLNTRLQSIACGRLGILSKLD